MEDFLVWEVFEKVWQTRSLVTTLPVVARDWVAPARPPAGGPDVRPPPASVGLPNDVAPSSDGRTVARLSG